MNVESPRGAMRRVERAVYLDAGVVFAPVAAAAAARFGLPEWVGHTPILCALALVGGVGNVSAVRRLMAVARAVAERDRAAGIAPAPAPVEDTNPPELESAVSSAVRTP
jgi:CDP-diacylglycerol--glycerol-3-phosphate 3-phosphatidyltransferase